MEEEHPNAQIPAANDILDALNHTGFILEYRVAQILRAADFDVSINYAYTDPESGKSREIDVTGEISRHVERSPAAVHMYFNTVVECKNTPSPFVLIGERDRDYSGRSNIQISFDPFSMNFPEREWHSIEDDLGLAKLPNVPQIKDFIGHQLIRMHMQHNRWRADNNSVYDSIIYPLAKAWQNQIKLNKEDDDDTAWQYPTICFTYPTIVTAGPVFIVDATESNPTVQEVGWASLKRTFRSKDLDGDFSADIVSFNHYEDYVKKRFVEAADAARNIMAENIHFYDPLWLKAHFGQPDDAEFLETWLEYAQSRSKEKG